jgi:hypothetical protein
MTLCANRDRLSESRSIMQSRADGISAMLSKLLQMLT